jgi:hypothetical protein
VVHKSSECMAWCAKTYHRRGCRWVKGVLKPHCIRCSHFKVDDVSALESSSEPPVHIVEDHVTASLHQQHTPWPWLRPWCHVTWIC